MKSCVKHWQSSRGYVSFRVALLSLTLVMSVMSTPSFAQTETKTGKFVELQTKGRTQTLIIEIDGEKHEIKMSPKVNFAVYGPGDKGFVRVGQFLEGKGVLTNKKLFLNELAIYLVQKGKKPPAGQALKAEGVDGQSANAYFVNGPILGVQPDKDYPEYLAVALKYAGAGPEVLLEKEYEVWVYHYDPTMAPAGADVELTVKPLNGGKFLPLSVKVHREEAFDSKAVFPEEAEKGK